MCSARTASGRLIYYRLVSGQGPHPRPHLRRLSVSCAPLLDYNSLYLDIHDCGEFLFMLKVGPQGLSKSNIQR